MLFLYVFKLRDILHEFKCIFALQVSLVLANILHDFRHVPLAAHQADADIEHSIMLTYVKVCSGDATLTNEPCSHLSTAILDELLNITVEHGLQKIVCAIVNKLGIHHITLVWRLNAIDKVKILDTWVSREFTPVDKTPGP